MILVHYCASLQPPKLVPVLDKTTWMIETRKRQTNRFSESLRPVTILHHFVIVKEIDFYKLSFCCFCGKCGSFCRCWSRSINILMTRYAQSVCMKESCPLSWVPGPQHTAVLGFFRCLRTCVGITANAIWRVMSVFSSLCFGNFGWTEHSGEHHK